MASYTRQSTFADGDLITAALFNNEYNQLVSAFDNATGHKHDGTIGEGPVISVLGDAGLETPLNKILIDTINDHIEFYINVSETSTQQLYIADGAIVPTIDNDIDLGTNSLQFKDLYINGTANIDSLVVDTIDINGGTIDGVTIGGTSAGAITGTTITGTSFVIGSATITETELEILDGATLSTTELNYVGGVTSNIQTQIDTKAPLSSPNLTGIPTAPTAAANTNTTQVATTAYVQTEITDLIGAAPGTLDTLNELAAAINNDANYNTTLTTALATKLPLAGGTMTGNVTYGDNVKANFGTSEDLQIYHDGSNSYITDVGTGNLIITGNLTGNVTGNVTGTVSDISNHSTSDLSEGTNLYYTDARFDTRLATKDTDDVSEGTSNLYYTDARVQNVSINNVVEDTTPQLGGTLDLNSNNITGTGNIDVTGTATMDGLTVDGVATIKRSGSGTAATIGSQGSTNNPVVLVSTNESANSVSLGVSASVSYPTFYLQNSQKNYLSIGTGGDISFYEDTGTSAALFWDASTERLGLGTTSPTTTLDVNGTIKYGSLSDGTITITGFADEDDMVSNSATLLPTQQSVKAYVDSQVSSAGGNGISFADNEKAQFGDGNDLQIYHDGTASYIDDAGTGNLLIRAGNLQLQRADGTQNFLAANTGAEVVLYHAGSAKLATTSIGIDVTGVITTDGLTTSADINFGDNDKAVFGAGSDLQIYHDGSNSYVSDQGTGNLRILAQNFTVRNPANNESMIIATPDAGVTLYYDNSSKFATTSTGIDVTGNTLSDSLTASGSLNGLNAGSVMLDYNGSSVSRILAVGADANTTGTLKIVSTASDGGPYIEALTVNSTGIDVTGTATMDGLTVVGESIFGTATGVFPDEAVLIRGNNGTSGYINGLGVGSSNSQFRIFADDTNNTAGSIKFDIRNRDRILIEDNGDISFYEDTGTSQALFWDASAESLGIGTTSPSKLLHVSNTSDFLVDVNGSDSALVFKETGGNSWRIGNDSSTDAFVISQSETSLGSDVRLFIANGGNVGIGTASPSDFAANANNLVVGSGSGTEGITINSGASNYGVIYFADGTSGSAAYAGNINYNHADNSMRLGTNGSTTDVVIDSSGKVGIGTTSPSAVLEVEGSPVATGDTRYELLISEDNTASAGRGGGLAFARQGVIYGGIKTLQDTASDSNASMYFQTVTGGSNTTKMTIDSSGNVGIGTSSPAYPLEVQSGGVGTVLRAGTSFVSIDSTGSESAPSLIFNGDANTGIWRPASDTLAVSTAGSEAMRIDSSGNLLVGKTTQSIDSVGGLMRANGQIGGCADGNYAAVFNRKTSDGDIVLFRKDTSTVGSIATTSGAINLYGGSGTNGITVDSSGNLTATANVTAYSDERLKDNIQTLQGSKVLEMRGVSFTKDGEASSGVIAQEIEKVAPELVHTAKDEMGTKSVAYGNLVGYLIEAIKDQQKEIEYMKSEIKTLKENK